MEGKDLLLELEDQNALLEQHVANKEHEISGLREQLRQRELALEAFVSPLKQTPMPERGSAAGSGRVQELSSRIHSLENERQALKRENKALQEIDVRKSKALDQLDRTIKSLEEERDVQKLAHAQEIAKLKARVGEAHALTRRHDELERAHAALAEECAALQAADNLRVKDWMAERRRLKEEVHHERQAKVAAQDNATTLRAKYVHAREQLATFRMSLRNCPPFGGKEGCVVVPLSPPFGMAGLPRSAAGGAAASEAGGAAASEAADEAEWAPVPYELYAQLETEVRHLRRKAGLTITGGGGSPPSSSARPAAARTPSATVCTSGSYPSGPGAARIVGGTGRANSPTRVSPRRKEPHATCSTTPYDVVHRQHSPYWEDLSTDLLRSVSELMPPPPAAPFSPPRGAAPLGLFGAPPPPAAQQAAPASTETLGGGDGGLGGGRLGAEEGAACTELVVQRVESDGWPELSNATALGRQVRPPKAAPASAPAASPVATSPASATCSAAKVLSSPASPAAKPKKSLPVNWRR